MNGLISESRRLLGEAGYVTTSIDTDPAMLLSFESATVLGFVFAYDDPAHLLARWSEDARTAISTHQLGLRRAQAKAWNTYTVFLAEAAPDYGQAIMLSAIEEDLRGTRKIARAGITDGDDLRASLLPLLPIQNAPRLEAVDMMAEVRLRTTELPARVVEAFLSEAQEALVAQMLEEGP